MSAVITSGPAPSARQKTRRTKVARHAYFVPWDNDNAGGWRYLPVDTVHTQTVTGEDELGNATRPVDSYIHKGFVPVEMVPEGDPRLDTLPLNWREHAMQGADPEWRNGAPKPKAPSFATDDSVAKAKEHWAKDPAER